MTTSTQVKGFSNHMNQIFGRWEGIDLTLRKYTRTLDDNGKIIGRTKSESTIKGVFSSVPFAVEEAAGRQENRLIRGLFLWAGTMPELDDEIIDTSVDPTKAYVIVDIPFVDCDIDNPVLITTDMREIPYGA